MAIIKKYLTQRVETAEIDYAVEVPFYRLCSVCSHTISANDVLSPLEATETASTKKPVPGFGAIYSITGDGAHTPDLSAFKQSSTSGSWVATLGTVNVIFFVYTGYEYVYSIIQLP